MRKLGIQLLLAIMLLLALAPQALALDIRTGARSVQIAQGETINDDLIFAGDSLTIDGTVNGDVFAVATSILVNGTINGNLFAAGNLVEIRGTVTGTALPIGDKVFVRGLIEKSLVSAASTMILDRSAEVSGNWIGAADRLQHFGTVGRGAALAASTIEIDGQIGQEVRAAADRLKVTSNGVIGGLLEYYSSSQPQIASGATVSEVVHHQIDVFNWNFQVKPWFLRPWLVALKFGGFLLVGLALLALFPRLRNRFTATLLEKPWQAPVAGALGLIAIPIAAVLMMITVVGLPLGFLTLFAYPALIYFGQVLLAMAVGQILSDRLDLLKNQGWAVLFILGAFVTTILVELPILGYVLAIAAVLYGLGGLILAAVQRPSAA